MQDKQDWKRNAVRASSNHFWVRLCIGRLPNPNRIMGYRWIRTYTPLSPDTKLFKDAIEVLMIDALLPLQMKLSTKPAQQIHCWCRFRASFCLTSFPTNVVYYDYELFKFVIFMKWLELVRCWIVPVIAIGGVIALLTGGLRSILIGPLETSIESLETSLTTRIEKIENFNRNLW